MKARRISSARVALSGAGVWFLLLTASIPSFGGPAEGDAPTPGELADISLEELMQVGVVYGASKHSQKLVDAPASVSVVTAEEIRRHGYRTLGDVLRNVRSFYVTYDRNYSYVGVRGFARPGDYNTRILLLVDGHRLNDNIYDGAYVGTAFPLDLELVERIEIIRGPSSSLYGTNAFFAVVNVITRSGQDWNGLGLAVTGGSQETFRGRLTYGHRFGSGVDWLLSGSAFSSQGQRRLYFPEFDSPETNGGVAEDADADKRGSFFSKLSFKGFTLQGVYSSRKKNIPTAAYATLFNDPGTYTIDSQSYLDGTYAHQFQGGLHLRARLHYDLYKYTADYIYEGDPGTAPQLDKDLGQGRWWGAELELSRMFFQKHRLTIGGMVRDNLLQKQKYYTVDPYDLSYDEEASSANWAVFAQGEIQIRDGLLLNAGLRYDHHSIFGGTAKPRLALIYNPFENSALKLLYGEAFRAPNTYELLFQSQAVSDTGGLRPETIATGELVWEQAIGDRLLLSASGYFSRISRLISQVPDPDDPDGYGFNNLEKADARGVELELETKLPGGAEARFSYAYQHAADGEAQLSNSPRHLPKFSGSAPLFGDKLVLAAALSYMGLRRDLSGGKVDPSLLANLTVSSRKLIQGLEVSASVYNLFDTSYADPGSEEHQQRLIEQDGRSFRLELGYRF